MPSNHTTIIGAWVKSKMSGRDLSLYYTNTIVISNILEYSTIQYSTIVIILNDTGSKCHRTIPQYIMSYSCCCCCFLTLTDPLRIQPWSQDRWNQTKSNRESEISMESRQKRTDKEVASKGHRRDKIENINENTQTVETN